MFGSLVLFQASLQCVLNERVTNEQVRVGQQEKEKEDWISPVFTSWTHEVERSVHPGGEDQGTLAQQGAAVFCCSLHD